MLIDFSYRNRWLLVILVLGFFLFAYKVGDRDLWAPDEDEYAQVSREMIQLDNWAYPTVNQKPYTIKPVLYNWLISLISLPWGDVNEFRARIFSSLAAVGTIVCIFYLGCLMFSNRAGFFGALILGTGVLFIQYGRWVQINMLATFFVMLTLFLFYRGYVFSEKRRSSYLLMYIPIGLGILTMGPVNLVLPALVIGLYLLVEKDLKHLRELELGWGILITLVIVAPYFLLVSLRGEYSFDLLVRTNFIRYFDTWTHKKPFYFYLPNLCWAFLPWTLLLPGSLQYALSDRSREKRKEIRFLLVWTVGIFLFFSFSQCKRIQYILPLFPALALLVAYLGDQAITNWKDSYYRKMVVIPSVALLVLFALSAVGLPVYALMFQKEWLWEMITIGIILAAVSLLFFWALKKTQPFLLFISPGIFILIFIIFGLHFVIPRIEDYKSPKPFCQQIVAHLDGDTEWAMYSIFRPAYVYYTKSFCIELEDEYELIDFLGQERQALVVIREKDYERVKDYLGVATHVLYRDKIGHRPMLLISN